MCGSPNRFSLDEAQAVETAHGLFSPKPAAAASSSAVGGTRRSGCWRRRRRRARARRRRGGGSLACRRLSCGIHPPEMRTPPPNSFSNHLEAWVFKEAVASVVFVHPSRVKETVDRLCPLPKTGTAEDEVLAKKRLANCIDERCCTGFILEGAPVGQLYLLTCVHALEHVFNADHPISRAEINDMFKVSILCDHAECQYRKRQCPRRKYVPAIVTHVDCSNDLMMLQVDISELRKKCKEPHRPLKLAPKFPGPLERVVMISWPPFRPRTACVGETSHPAREYDEIMLHAPDVHIFKLSEVNIMGDKGSSGVPLLDGAVDVAGVFHSGAAGTLSYSYFLALDELRDILTSWGIIAGEEGSL